MQPCHGGRGVARVGFESVAPNRAEGVEIHLRRRILNHDKQARPKKCRDEARPWQLRRTSDRSGRRPSAAGYAGLCTRRRAS